MEPQEQQQKQEFEHQQPQQQQHLGHHHHQEQQLMERHQHQQKEEYEHQQPQQHQHLGHHHHHLKQQENNEQQQQQSSLQDQQHGSQGHQEHDSVCDMDGNDMGSVYMFRNSFQPILSEVVDGHEKAEEMETKLSEINDKDKFISMQENETNFNFGEIDEEGVEKVVKEEFDMKQDGKSVTWHTMKVNTEVLGVEEEEMEVKTEAINVEEREFNMKNKEVEMKENKIDMKEDELCGKEEINQEENIPSTNSIDADSRNYSEIEQLDDKFSGLDNAMADSSNCVIPDLSANLESTEHSVTRRDNSAIVQGPSVSEAEVTFLNIDTIDSESETLPENCDSAQDMNMDEVSKIVDSERQQIGVVYKLDSHNTASEAPEAVSVTAVEDIAADKGTLKEKKKTKLKPAKLRKKKKENMRESEEGDENPSEKLKAPQLTKEKKEHKGGSGKIGTESLDEDWTGSHSHVNVEEGEDEDDWFSKFNDDGDCLEPDAMEELTRVVGEVKIEKSQKINYLDYQPKDKADMDFDRYNHIIEIYDFPAEFVTRDLITAFQAFMSRGFDLKWVDDTHALGIFSSAVAAQDALNTVHPLLKTCPLTMASRQSKLKAKRCTEFLQPYKPRPETTATAARRLVAGALGIATNVSKEKRDRERQQLKEAKEKRRQERTNREQIWEYGKCAMDDEGKS